MDKNAFWSIDKLLPHVHSAPTFSIKKEQDVAIHDLSVDEMTAEFDNPIFPAKSKVIFSYQLTRATLDETFLSMPIIHMPSKSCPFVGCNTFSPTYLSLNDAQRAYFAYFCSCADEGKVVQTSFPYLKLYLCLKMKQCKFSNPLPSEVYLVWKNYRKLFPLADRMFCDALCDYHFFSSLPIDFEKIAPILTERDFTIRPLLLDLFLFDHLFSETHTLTTKEIDLVLRVFSVDGFRKSKAYRLHPMFPHVAEDAIQKAMKMGLFNRSNLNKILFRIQIPSRLRVERKLFPGLPPEETPNRKISLSYVPLVHDENIRDRIGEVVRYLENRVRKILKIKNSLSRIRISNEHRTFLEGILSEYECLAPTENDGISVSPTAKPYQNRKLDINFEKASMIEEDSWSITKQLTEHYTAADGDSVIVGSVSDQDEFFDQKYKTELAEIQKVSSGTNDDFWEFASLLTENEDQFMQIIINCGTSGARQFCLTNGLFFEAMLATINTKAQNSIGDCIFDNAGTVYEDYLPELKEVFPQPKGE